MIGECINADFPPRFSVERRDIFEREEETFSFVIRSDDVQDDGQLTFWFPRPQALFKLEFRECIFIGGEGDGFGGPDAGQLVMAVAGVDAAPVVDDDVGAEGADDADHVFENLVAPDFFGFFGRFGIAKIASTGEIELHAIAAGGGEQFLRADEAELGSLFGPKSVLTAFAAGEGEQGHIGVKPASKIGEDGGAFIVGMRGDVKDARGDAGAVNGFDGFGETRTRSGCRRKLGSSGRNAEQPE